MKLNTFLYALIAACLSAGLAATVFYFVASRQAPTYSAEATLLASNARTVARQYGILPLTAPSLSYEAYRQLAASRPIASQLETAMGERYPQVRFSVQVNAAGDTALLLATARSNDPELAVQGATSLADSLRVWDTKRAVQGLSQLRTATLIQLEAARDDMLTATNPEDQAELERQVDLRESQLSYIEALTAEPMGQLEVLALPQDARVVPQQPVRNALVVGLGSFFLVYLAFMSGEMLNKKVRTADLAGALTGLDAFPGDTGEQLEHLRASFIAKGSRRILISEAETASGPALGYALAERMAEQGLRTLLLDATATLPAPELAEYIQDTTKAPVSLGETKYLKGLNAFAGITAEQWEKMIARWDGQVDMLVVLVPSLFDSSTALGLSRHMTSAVQVFPAGVKDEALILFKHKAKQLALPSPTIVLSKRPGRIAA